MDILNKSIYFQSIYDTWGVEKLARLYVKETVRLHNIPRNIVSYRDQWFQAWLWQALYAKKGGEPS